MGMNSLLSKINLIWGSIGLGALLGVAWICVRLLKKAIANRRQLGEKYRELSSENIPFPCCLLNGHGRIVEANRSWFAALGYTESDVIGQRFEELLVSNFINQYKLYLAQFESNEIPEKLTAELKRRDGSIALCQIKGKAVYKEPGKISRILLVFDNVGRQDRPDSLVKNCEDKLRLMFDKSADPILLIDEGVYVDCNESALKVFGYSDKSQLIGKHPSQCAPEFQPNGQLSSEVEKEMIDLAIKKGGHHFEWARLNAAGQEIIVDVSLTIIPYQGRTIIYNVLRDITDRKRIEEDLKLSEEKYRIVIENANEAIFVAQDNIIKFSNQKSAELIGCDLPELVDKPFIDYIYRDDREMFMYRHRNRQAGLHLINTYNFRIVDKNNNLKWLEVNAVKITWEGKPASLIFASDITARKKAEQELRESRKMLRLVLDNITVRVFWKDLDLKYLGSNRAFAEDAGFNTISDLIGKSDSDLCWKAHIEIYNSDDRQVIGSGIPKYNYEEPLTMPDGRQRIIRVNKIPLRSTNGSIVGILGTYQDITDEKIASEALQESQRQLLDVINFLPDATFVIDKNGVVLAWNRAMEKMTNVAAKDIIGKGNYEYALPFYGKKRPILINLVLLTSEELQQNYSSVVQQDETICAEANMINFAGRDTILWGVATTLRDSHGNVVGAIESIRDITDRKKIEMHNQSRAKFLSQLLGLTDSTEIANLSFEYISSIVPCEGGRLAVQKDYKDSSSFISISGFTTDLNGNRHYDTKRDILIPAAADYLGRAIISGKTLITTLPEGVESYLIAENRSHDFSRKPGISAVYIPLKLHGVIVGAFSIWGGAESSYTKERVEMLEGIAADLALALTAARITEALRENEQKIQTIANTAQDAIIMSDNSGKITFWNKAAEQIFGFESNEAIGKDVHQLLAPSDVILPISQTMAKRQMAGDEQIYQKNFESEAISKTGARIPIEISLAPVRMNDKWHAVATIRDITERKLAEKAIRESEQKYRQLIETSPVTIWSQVISGGEFVLISPAIEKLSGYTSEELMKDPQKRREFLPPETRAKIMTHVKKIIVEKKPVSFEAKLIHRDGSIKVVSLLMSPGFDQSGKLKRIDGVAIDITEKKRLEDQVIQSEKMAAIGVLAAGVAHEFNNLLCGIVGNLSLVQNIKQTDELFQKGLDDAIKAADQATELVQSLLSYSGRKGNDIIGEVNLANILKDITRLINKELKNKNVHLVTNYNDTPPIYGAPNQLQQVFLNILINAVHAVAENGIISISVWHDIQNAYVEISDNGVGISKDNIGKIFDPFYSTKGVWGPQKAKGTGLGLSISNNIVENHGGKIHVKSIEGIGTEFTVILPINIGHPDRIAHKIGSPNFASAIIVDFNEQSAGELANILKGFAGKCEILQWGEELIGKKNSWDSDLVILDASHPGVMDFARTIDFIKKHHPDVLVFLSSYGPIRHEFEEYIGQANGILFKPYSKDTIINMLSKYSTRMEKPDQVVKLRQ
jgi:PAS domain S-box-containing protein